MNRFYATVLALSLMLGKICFADPHPAAVIGADSPLVASARADREFLLARDSFERRNLKALLTARNLFRKDLLSYPLADYVEYWWLLASLAPSSAGTAAAAGDYQAFLAAAPPGPLVDGIRREWLKALARNEQWTIFAAEFPRNISEDAEITCQQWRYRLRQDDREAMAEARTLWNAARPAPDACYDVFGRISLDTETRWARVRALLAANQLGDARRSAAGIDKLPASFERATATVGTNPARYLEKEKVNSQSRASVELFLFAIGRLARSDAAKAAALLESRGMSLSLADREYAWAQVGMSGARQHEPAALDWFQRAGATPLDGNQAAWRARAALRAGDWIALRAAIEAMSTSEKREPAWRYWLARAESRQGNASGAAKLRESLARENHFYGLLAAEESGIVLSPPQWQGWKPARADLDAMLLRPGIVRALTLYRLGMKNEGLREWLFAIRDMNDQELLAAAEVARQANVPDRAISTAGRTLQLHDFAQRYPMPHRGNLQEQVKVQGLDEAWVYGLIRQESRFMADAKSRVGAEGLMQLMPATAQWAAKRVGLTSYSPKRVADIITNLALGSYYLRHVLDDLGHPVLATAAYNAGPGRARRWRADQALEGAIYAESIPFDETRDYVKQVMANTWYYAHQMGAQPVSLKNMLGTVSGRLEYQGGNSSMLSAMAPVNTNSVR